MVHDHINLSQITTKNSLSYWSLHSGKRDGQYTNNAIYETHYWLFREWR